MSDLQHTHRPGAPGPHPGALEVLVYVRQHCSVFQLPESGSVRVGRSPTNDLRIDDPSVSRFHFALHVGDVIEVEDLGSANGTSLFRNEAEQIANEPPHRKEAEARLAPAERRALRPGDSIRAGVALILVQVPSGAHPLPGSAISSRPLGDIGPPVLLDPAMRRAYEIAERAAHSGISVLITGETGAGKEIFAETIHARSNRCGRPLLRLNCAALTETLLESELFGHERGSFTGATQTKLGLLEANDQGTVFLDEIGEMPLSTQAKLLRVLEEKTIMRVGATKPRPIDVRFIWATNRDLLAQARLGKFRHDLYYRIAGVEFSIPPLRQRPLEIEPLARRFLEHFCRRSSLPVPRLSEAAVLALQRYGWPGNVRELKNVMERAPFLCGAGAIEAEHIPIGGSDASDASGFFPSEDLEATDVFIPALAVGGVASRAFAGNHSEPAAVARGGLAQENGDSARARITHALEQCAGNQTRAAQLLGVSRGTLINHLERLNMRRPKKV